LIRTPCRAVLAVLLTLLTVRLSTVAAQEADRSPGPSRPSGPVTLTLRIADGRRQFRPGEDLPIELEFESRVPKRFVVDGATYDRSGRLTIDEFMVEPNDAVTDPLLDYFALGGSIGGGIRGVGALGEKPFTIRLTLNEWFRFDKPGIYTLSVRSRRVTDDTKDPATTQSVVPVESNTVSFEILPRDPAWEASEVDVAVQTLNSPRSDVDRQKACRTLRFLGTDPAVDEMIRHYDEGQGCDFDYMAGLFGARDRERVVRQLEAGLRADDQAVSEYYLRNLALLSVYLQHPDLRPVQTRDTKGRPIPSSAADRLRDLVDAAKATYVEVLDAALPEKKARARAMILSWRVEAGRRTDPASSAAATSSRGRQREQLAATFLELPAERQSSLLEFQWSTLAGPAMVPVLRALTDTRRPASESLPDVALRRLYELAPAEGRARILREIRNPSRGASLKTLGILPDRELPELDDDLAGNVDMDADLDVLSIRAELLQRYASPAVSARVQSRVEDHLTQLACRPKSAFLAYFVRADPDLGQALLDRALASRELTGCHHSALLDVATLRMTPGVEATAVAHLDDPDPQVVISAADTLGRYGSRASAEPLRARFERWHRTWDGRQEELRYSHAVDRPNAMQGMVEFALLQALGRGQAWLTDEDDLRELRMLCVTDGCRTQADQMMSDAGRTRINIPLVDGPGNSLVELAQYQLSSLVALEQKLAQYPKGTSFTLDVSALDPQTADLVAADLMKFAAGQGITMRREQVRP
jgi:hypothetical protein